MMVPFGLSGVMGCAVLMDFAVRVNMLRRRAVVHVHHAKTLRDSIRRGNAVREPFPIGSIVDDHVFYLRHGAQVIAPSSLAFSNVMVGAVVVALLYFTRDILVPIALAILLSFALAPLVRFLQRLRFPRALAVMGAVATAVVIAMGLATMVMLEVNHLGDDLPRYQTTLTEKIHDLRDAVGRAGLLKNASSMLRSLDRELKAKDHDQGEPVAAKPSSSNAPQARTPIPVEVHQPDPGASETLVAMLRPLAGPFTTTGIVVVFLVFFLFQREDLRDRFIRLAGSDDLERTTAALDDAGRRLGKLFLTQLALNAVFGAVIGLGLAVIGVPSSPLWGLLAMILRFVPYIGAILAAAVPIALAAAVGPDWTMTIWTVALFAIVEALTGQVIEPLVCGKSAGLSPVAVVVAASFWTWLWGPLGLLLSTPLTLCLVVLARHVERLRFIDVMLGDQPALTPQQAAYQRMLTGDPIELLEQARAFLKKGSVEQYYEEIALGALRLAEADAAVGRLDDKRLENIHQTVSEIIEDIGAHEQSSDKKEVDDAAKTNIIGLDTRKVTTGVFCTPGFGRLDDCAALLVADFLKGRGVVARAAKIATEVEAKAAKTICVCYLEAITSARVDFTVRKLSRLAPSAKIIVCQLSSPPEKSFSDKAANDSALQSLEAVLIEIEKNALEPICRKL